MFLLYLLLAISNCTVATPALALWEMYKQGFKQSIKVKMDFYPRQIPRPPPSTLRNIVSKPLVRPSTNARYGRAGESIVNKASPPSITALNKKPGKRRSGFEMSPL